jgi:hypothetical protein
MFKVNSLIVILRGIEKVGTSRNKQVNPMRSVVRTLFVLGFVTTITSFQLIKTSLNITVRDEVGNTVEGATVQLFEKEEDYTAEKNMAVEGVTDNKGYLKLKELKPISYFVIVRKDDKDNSGGGERTGKLEEKRMNKVTVVIQ